MKRLSGFAWLLLLWTLVSLACSLVSPSPRPAPSEPVPGQPTNTPPPFTPVEVPQGKIAYASEREGVWQIIAMNTDGSEETGLTAAFGAYSRPVWSPDGQKIGMRIDIPSGSGIAVMDVRQEGGKLAGSQPIAISSAFADGPRWSPDGKKLVYSAAEEGRGWQTLIADLGTGSSQPVSAIPENSIDPDWSPDGSRIVFSWYTDPSRQIRDLFVINADGTGMLQLTATPAVNESMPAWSPDGTRIAFASAEDQATGSPRQDIFIMDSDGRNLVQLTNDPAGDFDPAWSPDGKQLAFVSERDANNDSNYEIYLINADGTGEMRLTNNHYTDRWPAWRAVQAQDTPPAACQPGISLVGDVTIPPGTRFAEPQPFSKVWRVKNTGTCAWTPAAYTLRFVEGEFLGAQMSSMPGAVQPGATVDLSVPLVAPDSPGKHIGQWQLFDGGGNPVSGTDGTPGRLAVEIEVIQPGQPLMTRPLYFIFEAGGSAQLWRMETDGRTRVQITSESAPVLFFDVSSEGRIALFSNNQVITTDASGANREVIVSMKEGEGRSGLAWSGDGKRLAYAMGGIRIRDMLTGEDRLLIADNDTRMPGLAVYEPLAWSPDGNKLLARTYLWEGAALKILSVNDGTVLAELPMESPAWSIDSQAVYYASASTSEMRPAETGLWRAPVSGAAAETLISNAFVWWPAQAPDGTLLFFMHPPALDSKPDYSAFLYRSDPSGGDSVQLGSQPFILSPNDTFNVRWTTDARQYVAWIVHPALHMSEVLLYSPDETPPLFLMQEIGQFRWGTP